MHHALVLRVQDLANSGLCDWLQNWRHYGQMRGPSLLNQRGMHSRFGTVHGQTVVLVYAHVWAA